MILDKIIFVLEFEYGRICYKLKKLVEFWKMYETWCEVFDRELDKRFKERYDQTFL